MSFQQPLITTLAAVLGDDSALVAELRGEFLFSAKKHLNAMRSTGDEGEWREAALRLKGLAASFGATALMEDADCAARARLGDEGSMSSLEQALTALAA